jgi:hypothetical protein
MTSDLKQVRRPAVFAAGITLMLLGIVMLVAPGPGILTLALGLGILATEFRWARRLLRWFQEKGIKIADRLFRKDSAIWPVLRSRTRREREPMALSKRSRPEGIEAQRTSTIRRSVSGFF